MGYKKIIIFSTFLLASLAFPAPVNEANRIIDIQQRQLEQERSRMEQQKSQEEFENTRFNDVPKIDKDSNFDDKNSNCFLRKKRKTYLKNMNIWKWEAAIFKIFWLKLLIN